MLREFKFLSRNSDSEKGLSNEEIENVPINSRQSLDPTRPPLSSIQEPSQVLKSGLGQEGVVKVEKSYRTPSKLKSSKLDSRIHLDTPMRAKKGGLSSKGGEIRGDGGGGVDNYMGLGRGNGTMTTPRVNRTPGRANATLGTPIRSVSKPPNPGFGLSVGGSRTVGNGNARRANFGGLSRGIKVSCNSSTVVNNVVVGVDVPSFELKEDPSFWMDHNIQVLIRVRPLSNMEKRSNGYGRCVKQDSAQCISLIGQPESRFTFDHVACEAVDQETLFRVVGLPMVENCLSGYNSSVFAYGQTGSGKTFTMLGDTEGLGMQPNPNRGLTPRIFEFLLARIREEEERRRDEKLEYQCKCSFLEIYNEQISDLLDPSSANLQLREDSKKGVYVENLSEFEVHTVGDMLNLLSQGSANRKVAATNMNRESSRSHSVFTCVIESKWEKDSTSNFRFARLNLVDLAGSERQKASGAEGERLKEAASINKSLSTLGHVIMVLVDVAQGRQRHVPYRDSRLTFLLQDSLGGNSKTTIIANVSPSICCTAETLNTLKFAQRAKLIQNNAIVNEDTSGDVTALQHQIRLLKEELHALKLQKVSRALTFDSETTRDTREGEVGFCSEDASQMDQRDNLLGHEYDGTSSLSSEHLKSLEVTLGSAFRREQMAETSIKQLEAEIEQLNRLVHQREEDTRSTKMMLKFREDKIQRMESLLGGLKPTDDYLLEENNALSKEIQLLRAKVDKNPEVTRFAQENIRLLEKIRRFQDFYEEGEREMLMAEVSELRNQLTLHLDGSLKLLNHPDGKISSHENNLRACSPKYLKIEHAEEVLELQLELDILKTILKEEKIYGSEADERAQSLNKDLQLSNENLRLISKQYEDVQIQLQVAKSVIEALERQQLTSIDEIECLKNNNSDYAKVLHEHEVEISSLKKQLRSPQLGISSSMICSNSVESPLQEKLKKMHISLEKAKKLNQQYQSDLASHEASEGEMDQIRRQVEAETAEVIVCLQEELTNLLQEAQESSSREAEIREALVIAHAEMRRMEDRLYLIDQDNKQMGEILTEKEEQLQKNIGYWKSLTSEIESILSSGHEALEDAAGQVDIISSTFPQNKSYILQQCARIRKYIEEKESTVEELNRSLEDALDRRKDLEVMLKSLRGAALAMTEAHEQECSEIHKEILHLTSELHNKTSALEKLEKNKKLWEGEIQKTSDCAAVAFVIVNRLSELNSSYCETLTCVELELQELTRRGMEKDSVLCSQALQISEAQKQIEALKLETHFLKDEDSSWAQQKSKRYNCGLAGTLKLDDENDEILQTRGKLSELKNGILTVRLCMNDNGKRIESPGNSTSDGALSAADNLCDTRTGLSEHVVQCLKDEKVENATIILLRKEIESARESLQQVQSEMAKLQVDKEDSLVNEKDSQERIKYLMNQVSELQTAINSSEEEIGQKLDALENKIQMAQNALQYSCSSWVCQKELLESELSDAKIFLNQKTSEASCILAKFEEANDTMKDTDIMVKELTIANEALELEIRDMKRKELALSSEIVILKNDESLLSAEDVKDLQCEKMVKEFEADLTEMGTVLAELESTVAETLTLHTAESTLIDSEILELKAHHRSKHFPELLRSWLEDTWCDVIAKDSAVSVLHLCHLGVLLETINGLNVENGLLHHGLCESNFHIAELKEHNSKSRRELELFGSLTRKLLTDVNRSFSSTGDLTLKLTSFDKKISDLQIQEESMLQRSDQIVSELAAVVKELDLSNRDVMAVLLEQESSTYWESQEDNFILEQSSKEFELLILSSELRRMYDFNAAISKAQQEDSGPLNVLKKNIIICSIDAAISETMRRMECDFSLQSELLRKDEIIRGLQCDLSLLQDSTSIDMDKNDEIERLAVSCIALENELETKLCDLDLAVAQTQKLEDQLQEKIKIISTLESGISKEQKERKSFSLKNLELVTEIENSLKANKLMKDEVEEMREVRVHLEMQVAEMDDSLGEMSISIDSLKCNLVTVMEDNEELCRRILTLDKELEIAQGLAEEKEAIAEEAREVENAKNKKRVIELEDEEENNALKSQNEELGTKLRKAEGLLLRVREELTHFQEANGISPYNFDEELRLGNKLKNKMANERIKLSEFMPRTSPINSSADENGRTPTQESRTSFLSSLDR